MADLEALINELTSSDDGRAARALAELSEHGPEAIEYLLKLQASDEADHRWWATAALAAVEGDRAGQALLRALEDLDPAVRQVAVAGLREHPRREAIPVLIRLLGDDDRLLARLASGALAAHGPEAVEALIPAMRSDDPRVRIEAARALGDAGDPGAIPALFAALSDRSVVVVHLAEVGLERLGVGMVFFEP